MANRKSRYMKKFTLPSNHLHSTHRALAHLDSCFGKSWYASDSNVITHCEILGSYLQQPHQLHASRAHFKAEPHSQTEANRQKGIFCPISRSKLTNSVERENTSLPCSIRQIDVIGGLAGILPDLSCFEKVHVFYLHLMGSLAVALRL